VTSFLKQLFILEESFQEEVLADSESDAHEHGEQTEVFHPLVRSL